MRKYWDDNCSTHEFRHIHCEFYTKREIIHIFYLHGSVHRKYIPICIQQDANLQQFIISENCSTCFGCYFYPSSGAHTTVSTASGMCAVGGLRHLQHTQTSSNSSTIAADSSNGVTNIICCRYSCMRS